MKFLAFIFLLSSISCLSQAKLCAQILRNSEHQVSRAELIENYAEKSFRTVEENKRWISAFKEKRKGLYVEFTASELKNLNDKVINDKDLVTALVNLRKEYELDAIKSLGEEVLKGAEIYSDYKTVRLFIPVEGEAALKLSEKLEALFAKVDKDYKDKLLKEGLVRRSDLKTRWFEMGMGEDPDLASVGARLAKEIGESSLNMLLDENKKLLEEYRLKVKNDFEDIVSPDLRDLLTEDGKNFNFRAVEVFRKNRKPKDFKQAILRIFGLVLPTTRARQILKFFNEVDLFSPSLIVAERTSVTVDYVEFGAFSLDFAGLGAKNLQATIKGVLESASLEDLFIKVRENEEAVTKIFNRDKERILQTALEYFRTHKESDVATMSQTQEETIVKFSGDEGIIVPNREITMNDVMRLQKAFLDLFGSSQLRMTYIRSTPEGKLETDMVSFAESVEKALKKKLVRRIPPEVLERTQFNVWVMKDIQGQKRTLELDLYSSAVHSPAQREFIRNAFSDVIIEMDLMNSDINIQPAYHVYGRFLE